MTWIIKVSGAQVQDRYVYVQSRTSQYLRILPSDATRFKTKRAASQAIKTHNLTAQLNARVYAAFADVTVVRLADEMLDREATRST